MHCIGYVPCGAQMIQSQSIWNHRLKNHFEPVKTRIHVPEILEVTPLQKLQSPPHIRAALF